MLARWRRYFDIWIMMKTLSTATARYGNIIPITICRTSLNRLCSLWTVFLLTVHNGWPTTVPASILSQRYLTNVADCQTPARTFYRNDYVHHTLPQSTVSDTCSSSQPTSGLADTTFHRQPRHGNCNTVFIASEKCLEKRKMKRKKIQNNRLYKSNKMLSYRRETALQRAL